MLVIRYNRTGRRNKPFFRLVVQEKTIAPGGKHAEVVGSWDPHAKVAVMKEDRIKYWLSVGAQPSDSVYNLLVTKGVLEGKKRSVKMSAKKNQETNDQATSDKEEKSGEKKVQETTDQVTSDKEEKNKTEEPKEEGTPKKEENTEKEDAPKKEDKKKESEASENEKAEKQEEEKEDKKL